MRRTSPSLTVYNGGAWGILPMARVLSTHRGSGLEEDAAMIDGGIGWGSTGGAEAVVEAEVRLRARGANLLRSCWRVDSGICEVRLG